MTSKMFFLWLINPFYSLLIIKYVIQNTYQKYGFLEFYNGVIVNVLGATMVNLDELVSYDYGKQILLHYEFKDNIVTHFISSINSGIWSTLMSTPTDVVKSNYMNQPIKYNYNRCFHTIFREHGLFYFGKSLSLDSPWPITLWVSYENLYLLFDKKRFEMNIQKHLFSYILKIKRFL